MQLRLILFSFFLSLNAFATDDKSIKELFTKYDLIMNEKKFELIDEVFSKKFLKESGGRSEFIIKVKSLPTLKNKKNTEMTWKKGVRTEIYLAKPKLKKDSHDSEFIVVKEEDKLKIDGTISDAN